MSEQEITWKDRIVGQEKVAPSDLLANPFNYRTHPKFQQEVMESVLNEVGWIQQVIVNQRTGHVVDGHMRIMLAMRHDEPLVPVLYVDLTEDEERIVLATYDHVTGMASIDKEALSQLINETRAQDDNLQRLVDGLSLGRSNQFGQPVRQHEAEEQLSPEMFERQDYLVFTFDNEFDWKAACQAFGVGMVKSQPVGKRSIQQRGMGRVIHGKELLRKVLTDGNTGSHQELSSSHNG